MMRTVIVEIRDAATCIPAIAIQMLSDNPTQAYYLRRLGYPSDGGMIMLLRLADGKGTCDPYSWESLGLGIRTMTVAHVWITEHFAEIKDGDVIDVEFILGETTERKQSERA